MTVDGVTEHGAMNGGPHVGRHGSVGARNRERDGVGVGVLGRTVGLDLARREVDMSWGVRLTDSLDRVPLGVVYGLWIGVVYLAIKAI